MDNQNISDLIESYLKNIMRDNDQIEIKRSEIAERFDVVPSQINYVIKTRFTIRNGYVVESKRGGGGYIRIEKVNLLADVDVFDSLIEVIGDRLSQRDALTIIQSLYTEDLINQREANLMAVAIAKQTFKVKSSMVDEALRARIMVGFLNRLRCQG